MKDIGYVISAIPTDDIKKLDLSTYDAVSAAGQPIKVSKEQVRQKGSSEMAPRHVLFMSAASCDSAYRVWAESLLRSEYAIREYLLSKKRSIKWPVLFFEALFH